MNVSDRQRKYDSPPLWRFTWRWLPGEVARRSAGLLEQCSDLYARSYGTWGPYGPRPGEPIRQSRRHLEGLLASDHSWLACAIHDDRVVGYCIALRLPNGDSGPIAWITQLVVDPSYRQQRLATTLLFSIWQFSDCYAWGLVTPNPFAVRALETATRRSCRISPIREFGPAVLERLSDEVPYIPSTMQVDSTGRLVPKLDTQFFLSLEGLPSMIKAARRGDRRWALGEIRPGEEWFACTFHSQRPESTDDRRLRDLLAGADQIWISAYEGMTLDAQHLWHRHTDSEVDFVIDRTGAPSGARVLDVGCGDGRHANRFAQLGYTVVGVDISERLIEKARAEAGSANASFERLDARRDLPAGPFDLALCLYDVIGSSGDAQDDLQMLRNIRARLQRGARLVATVMNTEPTRNRMESAHLPTTPGSFAAALEELAPSSTMEKTGDVFKPELLLYYEGAYYRKEQFSKAEWRLPTELVIRDQRFTPEALAAAVEAAGFNVELLVPVQAGNWRRQPALSLDDSRAKELLVIATAA